MKKRIFNDADPYFIFWQKKVSSIKWICLLICVLLFIDLFNFVDIYYILFSMIIIYLYFLYSKTKIIFGDLEAFLLYGLFGIWCTISTFATDPFGKGLGLKAFSIAHLSSLGDIILVCFVSITILIPFYTIVFGLAWEFIIFRRKRFQILCLCTDFDSPPDEHNSLHKLVYKGKVEEISSLLDKKSKGLKTANFDFFETDCYGRYPIHFAKTQEMVSFLLSQGVKIDETNSYSRQTLLHLMSRRGDLRMVDFLLKQGADINRRDAIKRTPLDYAKNNRMRNFLIANGGKETNLQDKIKYLITWKSAY